GNRSARHLITSAWRSHARTVDVDFSPRTPNRPTPPPTRCTVGSVQPPTPNTQHPTPRFGDLNPPTRLLLGSGPSNPEPRVWRALAMPLIGQFDPAFTAIMDEVSELSRRVFRTGNRRAFPVSGSSRSGLEAALASLIEPGDRVIVGNFGRFGDLFCEI